MSNQNANYKLGLLKLESDRRENDEHIAAVYFSMATMVYSLRALFSQTEDPGDALKSELSAMTESMEEFGVFADLYYNKCKMKIIRFLRSGEFKDKLTEYSTNFSDHQGRIEFILTVQVAGDSAQMKVDIKAILERVNASTKQEREAEQLIMNQGGPQNVIEDAEVLRQNLDQLISENRVQFELKLNGAKQEISEAINRSTQIIIGRLDAGPHDFIENPDMKEIWKVNRWKLSVKCRYFVDGICNYLTGRVHPTDVWTLSVLSNVINHPAIGEAIDEDASGFVSVLEINHFLTRRGRLSVPVWLAYWAVGWQYLNIQYTIAVDQILDGIEEECQSIKPTLTDVDLSTCDEYLVTIKLLRHIVNWLDVAFDGGMEDVDDQTESELDVLTTQLSEENEQVIEDNLKRLNFEITDPALLVFVTGQSSVRIEQVIMSLLYIILKEQKNSISSRKTNINEGTEATDSRKFASHWQSMDATLSTLVLVFHVRMRALIRSWRSQKVSPDLQVKYYAGGLYSGWYEEYNKPDSVIAKLLEPDDDDEEDSEESSSADSGAPVITESPDTKIDKLSLRVTELDLKLERIEALLHRLLATSENEIRSENLQRTDPFGQET
ncbi:hypothetical protein GGX14DRAFT_468209 [Mycena pura]|uniref:EF-hand domain-containing protein n=1 Tax=Mycena pura TaxID=153505 RepID=A0AAD6YAF1_9AGAR|nr:hypothetical protein GGX14DRAFT_468209 [Mycena pura]